MSANELRIGNYVNLKDKGVYQISSGHDIDELIDWNDTDYMLPIELSYEWLVKFGFKRSDSIDKSPSFFFKYVGASELHINPINGVCWIERDNNIFNNPALIEYVHQTQNLYFALTGTELSV